MTLEEQWALRTWADVVEGDTVRLPDFPDVQAYVSQHYQPTARPAEVWVVLDLETDFRHIERTAPVEIRVEQR